MNYLNLYLTLAVCIVGGICYRFCKDSKTARLGEIAFFVGLLLFLYVNQAKLLHL